MKPHEYIALEVARERERQIEKEGYDPSHDDAHSDGAIAHAAACYAAGGEIYTQRDNAPGHMKAQTFTELWPWHPVYDKRLVRARRKQLVIAAALCIAEIERLDRAQQSAQEESKRTSDAIS